MSFQLTTVSRGWSAPDNAGYQVTSLWTRFTLRAGCRPPWILGYKDQKAGCLAQRAVHHAALPASGVCLHSCPDSLSCLGSCALRHGPPRSRASRGTLGSGGAASQVQTPNPEHTEGHGPDPDF